MIQNTDDYLRECYRQLNDPACYRKDTNTNPLAKVQDNIKYLLKFCKETGMDEDLADLLIVKHPRLSLFYTIPKVHKEGNRGRGIISSIDAPTSKISHFIDETYKRYLELIESYTRDTTHFLQMLLELDISEDDILFVLDVAALYPSIPHGEGIAALGEFAEKHNISELPVQILKRLAYIVLTNNVFEFDGSIYKQLRGTAMGTKMAPTYAIIFMDNLERKLLQKANKKPRFWKRFIDDIFGIWRGPKQELLEFVEWLNHPDQHPTIKFTCEASETSVHFLDVKVYKVPGNPKLQTTLFRKETDRNTYLHYRSSHPVNQKNSIPYSQLLRVRRICSEEEEFEKHARKMVLDFQLRGYPTTILQKAYDKACAKTQTELLQPRTSQSESDKKLRLITKYNPHNPAMHKLIMQHSDTLKLTRKKAFDPSNQFQTTYGKNNSIGDLLFHTKHPWEPSTKISTACGNCHICVRMAHTSTITSHRTKKTYPIRGNFNCKSNHIVYCLTCIKDGCGEQYVGETTNELRIRMSGHFSDIRKKKETSGVSRHFNQPGHTINHIKIVVLDKERNKNRRLRLEESWMALLKTRSPLGMNDRN